MCRVCIHTSAHVSRVHVCVDLVQVFHIQINFFWAVDLVSSWILYNFFFGWALFGYLLYRSTLIHFAVDRWVFPEFTAACTDHHWSLQAQEEELQRWKAELTKVEGSCLCWCSSRAVTYELCIENLLSLLLSHGRDAMRCAQNLQSFRNEFRISKKRLRGFSLLTPT